MQWTTTIGRLAGIDLKIHATFLLLLAWVAFVHWRVEQSIVATLVGLVFVLALFFCVVLHELGHALAARRYGVETHDIILLPIGGVARLKQIPGKPVAELVIALAGPAVNVVIAALLAVWLQLTGGWQPVEELSTAGGSFAERLLVVNLFLVLFNLVPAFPMDGGRVLRALLSLKIDPVEATRIAASIGRLLAVGFAVLGFFGSNPILVLIAAFVWLGAGQELRMVRMRRELEDSPPDSVVIPNYRVLRPPETLEKPSR